MKSLISIFPIPRRRLRINSRALADPTAVIIKASGYLSNSSGQIN